MQQLHGLGLQEKLTDAKEKQYIRNRIVCVTARVNVNLNKH